ncbi:MAG: DUF3349 domain-containing protein [Mycobacterium sp.]|uniref:DUF3349 domain-containing protein n=1 Tax=Mycobacterium sp. TaxID=1785 RepID=UPI00260DE4B8|nr:DUF3349 domain-containing protein [Mycobacterium sp.]MDI3314200.1 DUF3349 domain-containing protein [Mycobacterium sp.]
MAANAFLASVLRWLQVGYPDGVPGPDRVPLLVLLRSTSLTEDQITEVVHNITAAEAAAGEDRRADKDEIAEFVSGMTHYDAGPENIRRVAATLAAAGWPLAGVDPRLTESDPDADRAAPQVEAGQSGSSQA